MPKSAMKTFQDMALKDAQAIVDKAPATLTAWKEDYAKHFPHATVSDAATALEKDGNASLAAALSATANLIDQVSTDLTTLERAITLAVPQMEDGNNFGVTIQLSALKQIVESKDKHLDKALDELTKYSSARADALEKCKLPTASTTETTTTSESKGTEKGEAKESNSTSTETKSTKTTVDASSSPEYALRQQAVVAVDLLYYHKAKNLYTNAMNALLYAVDFFDKNSQKLTQPKGSRDGSSSAYSSMY